MFGKWAYGLFQSEDRYKSQAEVLAAAAGYRKAHIPVDVIVQDWYYWEPLPIGSHVMNPQRYPDPKAMVDTQALLLCRSPFAWKKRLPHTPYPFDWKRDIQIFPSLLRTHRYP